MANEWIKLKTTEGEQFVRTSVIDRMKPHYLSKKTEVYSWQGHLICVATDHPENILDAIYEDKPVNKIGFQTPVSAKKAKTRKTKAG